MKPDDRIGLGKAVRIAVALASLGAVAFLAWWKFAPQRVLAGRHVFRSGAVFDTSTSVDPPGHGRDRHLPREDAGLSNEQINSALTEIHKALIQLGRRHAKESAMTLHDTDRDAVFYIPPLSRDLTDSFAARMKEIESTARPDSRAHFQMYSQVNSRLIEEARAYRVIHLHADADGFASWSMSYVDSLDGVQIGNSGSPNIPAPRDESRNPHWQVSGQYEKSFHSEYFELIPPVFRRKLLENLVID